MNISKISLIDDKFSVKIYISIEATDYNENLNVFIYLFLYIHV
jgi:hypothetical protein